MRKGLLIAILLAAFGINAVQAQEDSAQQDTVPPVDLQRQVFIYGLATKYNDRDIAKASLYNILSITPQNIAILDSLALMYYQDQEYASAALISQDILAMAPNNEMATEIAAISFETLGVKDRAVNYYEKLYLANNEPGILYQVAFLQYELKRYAEANINVDILLEDPKSENQFLTVRQNQVETQQIPMRAGVYRLQGLIRLGQGDTEAAKESFNKALEIAPTFSLVQAQLKQLN